MNIDKRTVSRRYRGDRINTFAEAEIINLGVCIIPVKTENKIVIHAVEHYIENKGGYYVSTTPAFASKSILINANNTLKFLCKLDEFIAFPNCEAYTYSPKSVDEKTSKLYSIKQKDNNLSDSKDFETFTASILNAIDRIMDLLSKCRTNLSKSDATKATSIIAFLEHIKTKIKKGQFEEKLETLFNLDKKIKTKQVATDDITDVSTVVTD